LIIAEKEEAKTIVENQLVKETCKPQQPPESQIDIVDNISMKPEKKPAPIERK
jgi:hypothetical protein